ncbi:MAG: DUF3987 domain-containing protein [Spirochaetes bacterium]|nr:MAG: DUF3987 domain-containing protein [Spirochaetota bacterium]
MKTYEQMDFHPTSEQLVQVLCEKTQNDNPLFFRVLVAYYFTVIASMMRCSIATHDRGNIPVNMYALALATSGAGKGFSTNIVENQVINLFRTRFLEETFPLLAEVNIGKIGAKRAARKGTDTDEEIEKARKEFDGIGPLMFNFDSGTPAAVKQMRHKLLMADAGSMNLQIDEIGSNLLGNIDVLTTFLELYDVGRIKQKLIKNTTENVRVEEIHGSTPTNMLLFGTPAKLLNGSKTEEELYSMLETGYARRCFFGYIRHAQSHKQLTPEQVYDALTNQQSNQFLQKLSDDLESLADMSNVNRQLLMSKQTSLLLIEYRLKCEAIAAELAEHEEIKKAEISHRYFKALKLAGAYAFIDNAAEVTETHLYNAIKLAEESGEAFDSLLTRDRNYVKLAKYVASSKVDVTQADLVEDLPFYRGAMSQKVEMMNLAIAYGYKNNIIIKKAISDGIEFFRGETLQETNLSKLTVAYSTDITTGYRNEAAPWEQLHKLTQAPNLHWVTHHLKDGYRNEENCFNGFDLVVVDVDGTVDISTVKLLLKSYKYLLYTTKRHTDTEHRFRLIFPSTYHLKLDAKDYKEFMSNVYEWLPFEVDNQTNQRSRKWLSNAGSYYYNEGDLLDVLPFIPKTSKSEERKALLKDQQALDNLERWMVNQCSQDGRNNTLLKYALVLVDAGFVFEDIRKKVLSLNDKFPDPLEEAEIMGTVMVTVAKQLAKQ